MSDSNDTKRAAQMSLGSNTAAERPQEPQTVVYIDPQNRTGKAKDNNKGLDPTDPWLTWSDGFLPRFGVSPVLRSSTTVNFMSSSPSDGSDPVFFSPIMDNFAALRFNGTLDSHNIAGSGALAGVVAKNRGTGQTLTANLSATPAAAVGQVLVNTTAGKQSRCMIRAALGGGVFQLTQPLTINDNWPNAPGDPTEVDTYANGDTYQIYNEDMVDFVKLDCLVASFDNVFANEFTVVTNLGILKPIAASGVAPCYLADTTVFLYSWLQRRVNFLRSAFSRNSIMWGCLGLNGIQGGIVDVNLGPNFGNRPWLMGGAYGSVSCPGTYVDDDVIFTARARLFGGTIGAACVATGAELDLGGECILTPEETVGAIYGGGLLNVHGRLSIQGVSAVASLLQSGGLQINGQTSGFTATHANPSVVNGAVAITPANIDANASGLFIPGGGAIATF